MKKASGAWLLCLAGVSGVAAAGEQPLICFGNEPSWSVDLTEPGIARFATPDQAAVTYRGQATRHAFLSETLWRGSPAAGRDLVVWLQDTTCTDNMSGSQLPVTARVSLPDGRFLSGCCRVPTPAVGGSPPAPLEGATWRLQELPGAPSAALAKLDRPVTVRFESGRLSGFAGCNNFSGSYALDGDRLQIGPVASTQMACPEPGSSIETAVHKALSGTLRYAVVGDDLKATTAAGETLRFRRAPPPQLAGVDWKVTSFNNNRHAVVGVLGESNITVSFKDGQVAGSAGCNNFHGTYATEGSKLQLGPLATTRRACDEPLMTQEREFLAALASAVTWSIDGNVLDMHRADGERAIWAVAK
jgi:heat shock protein HslJ